MGEHKNLKDEKGEAERRRKDKCKGDGTRVVEKKRISKSK